MPPSLPPLLPDTGDSIASMSQSQTAQALPLSESATSGATPDQSMGDGAPSRTERQPINIPPVPDRPERPDLPRVDPEEDFPGGRPERDQDARNRKAIQGLLGAVGAALAPQDSPVAFNVASGLSQGAAQQAQASEEEFRQRQQAFREFVTDAQRFNRQARQAEEERDFESRMADFEGRMSQRQQAIEGELKRRRAGREREFEREQARREHRRTLKEIRARGRQDRRTERIEQGEGSSARDIETFKVPQDPQRAQTLLQQVNQEIQALQSRRGDFVTPEVDDRGNRVESVDDEYLDQMSRLRRQRAALQQVVGPLEGPDVNEVIEDVVSGSANVGGARRSAPRQSQVRTDQAGPTRQASRRLDQYLQVARSESPRAALDSLESDYRQGNLSEEEATMILEQIQKQFSQ